MSLLFYNIFLFLYNNALRLAACWNPKAAKWINGRKNWQNALRSALGDNKRPVVWMHCASLGEFEQGRPVLEAIRRQHPDYFVLISFFSPSGYEIRKNYLGADYICYLPMDGRLNARKFVEWANPRVVIWVKYEFWYYYLQALQAKKAGLVLVAGRFRPSQAFFKWYGGLHRSMLKCFTHLFVQDLESARLLQHIGVTGVTVAGDTRYDRVSAIADQWTEIDEIHRFVQNQPTIVCGSTWPEDEEELDHFANTHPEIRFIIAPHEIEEPHLKEIEKLFHRTIRFSVWKQNNQMATEANVLIIDNIGLLSRLYKYARIAYVGGGFGDDGLHNILEAAVYGVPVVHGPTFDRFPEAAELIEAGGGFSVDHAIDLENRLSRLLNNPSEWTAAAAAAQQFVAERKGATQTIISYLEVNRLLTN